MTPASLCALDKNCNIFHFLRSSLWPCPVNITMWLVRSSNHPIQLTLPRHQALSPLTSSCSTLSCWPFCFWCLSPFLTWFLFHSWDMTLPSLPQLKLSFIDDSKACVMVYRLHIAEGIIHSAIHPLKIKQWLKGEKKTSHNNQHGKSFPCLLKRNFNHPCASSWEAEKT